MIQTFAPAGAAQGGKCLNRTTGARSTKSGSLNALWLLDRVAFSNRKWIPLFLKML